MCLYTHIQLFLFGPQPIEKKDTLIYNKDFLYKEKAMVRNDNFITIQGWMLNELGLKGNALLVYALIYGFSQTEDCEFTGSASYLAEWCGCSRQTIANTLNKLVKSELLIKKEEFKNNIKFCSYSVNLTGCQNFLQGGVKKFDRGVSKFFTGGCQNFLHNNIDINNKKDNIEDNKKNIKKKSTFSNHVIDVCLRNDITDDKSIEIIEDFLTEMKIKTKGAIEANISKLAGKDFTTIQKCIKTSYERNYKYIAPPEWLKPNRNSAIHIDDTSTLEDNNEFKHKAETNDSSLFYY